jgi:hypothetical protein
MLAFLLKALKFGNNKSMSEKLLTTEQMRGSGYGSGYGDGDGSGSGSGYGDGYGSS